MKGKMRIELTKEANSVKAGESAGFDDITISEFINFVTGASYNHKKENMRISFMHLNGLHQDGSRYLGASKLAPSRAKTVTTGEYVQNLSNMFGMNVFMDTAFTRMYKDEYGCLQTFQTAIHSIVLDVDTFSYLNNDNMTKEMILSALEKRYPLIKSLVPSGIVLSGRKGFQLFYTFSDDLLRRQSDARFLLNFFGNYFCADKAHLSLGASFRVPGSINGVSGKRVRGFLFENPTICDIAEFIEKLGLYCKNKKCTCAENGDVLYFFENEEDAPKSPMYSRYEVNEYCSKYLGRKEIKPQNENYVKGRLDNKHYKKKNQKEQKKEIREYELRYRTLFDIKREGGVIGAFATDLCRYFDENNGDIEGHRNTFLFLTACCVNAKSRNYNFKDKYDVIYEAISNINKKFIKPLPDHELRSIAKIVNKNNYNISAEMVREGLDLSWTFMRTSAILYTPERKKEAKRKANIIANEKRKKAVKKRKDAKIAILRKMVTRKKFNMKFAMKITGWSRNTIKKYIRSFMYENLKKIRDGVMKNPMNFGPVVHKLSVNYPSFIRFRDSYDSLVPE